MPELTIKTPQTGEKIKIYMTTWCGDCRFAKRWFDAHGIAYQAINIEEDEDAAELVKRVNGGARAFRQSFSRMALFLLSPLHVNWLRSSLCKRFCLNPS